MTTSNETGMTLVKTDAADEARRIQETIDGARVQIAASLEALQGEVVESLDWKGWVADNPWKAVGIAAAVGFYVGMR